jgi:hypothetical protein
MLTGALRKTRRPFLGAPDGVPPHLEDRLSLADARLVTVAEREGGQACGEVSVESELEHDEQLVHLRLSPSESHARRTSWSV